MKLLKQKMGRKLLGFLLTLAMVVGLMPGMSLTAYAEGEATPTAAETLAPTVDSNNKVTGAKVLEYAGQQWYVIASGTTGVQIASDAVTTQDGATTLVLLAKENWGTAVFDDTNYKNAYGNSKLKTAVYDFVTSKSIKTYYTGADEWKNDLVAQRELEGGADENNSNFQSEDKISGSGVDGVTLWPLSAAEVSRISNSTILQGNGNWWLRSPSNYGTSAACVYSSGSLWRSSVEGQLGVRPALCLNLTSDIFASEKSDESGVYELTKAEPAIEYPLWVGGVQVTSENASDIFNDGKASYNAETKTLTLNNYTYEGAGKNNAAIYAEGNLIIHLTGTNTVTQTPEGDYSMGLYVEGGNLTVTGSGKLTANSGNVVQNSNGIYVNGNFTLDSGATLIAIGGNSTSGNSRGVGTSSHVTVNGTLEAVAGTGSDSCGISAYTGYANLTIGSDSIVSSVGANKAVDAKVKNSIVGTGWTDKEGTTGKTGIPTSTEGRKLDSYKKVQFSKVKDPATVTENPKPNTLTYTGTAQELVTAGTATGGTMQYALGTATEATQPYTTSIPTATEAGTYYVWYKVVGDENHNDTKPVYVTALINEKKITPSISTEKRSILYTGQPQELVTPGEAAGGTMVYAIGKNDTTVPTDTEGWSEDIPTGTDPGTYYVWYKVKGDGDHLDSDPVCVIVTITKLTVDMKPVPEGKTTSVDTSTNPDVGESLANEAKALAAENDTNVELYLSVAPKGQSKATESEVLNNDESMHSKVQSQFKDENSVSVDVLDIYIKQTIKGESSDLKETKNVLEIGIGYDFTGKYDPVVVRKHGETAEVFKALSSRPADSYEDARFYADTANNKLYIYSDKFSTYVVAYSTEENNAQNRTTASLGGSSSSSTTASYPTTVPVYRLFNTVTGQHFYTANKQERDLILEKNAADGWTDEGIAFKTAQKTSIPVYRVFDMVNGNHIFTTDAAARDLYIANGYRDEGIAWYAPATVGRKVYKLTDAKSNKVTYTTSKAEADSLVDLGFTCEDAEFVVY